MGLKAKIFFLFVLASTFSFMVMAVGTTDSSIILKEKLLSSKNADTADFNRLVDICLQTNNTNLLMATYRQLLDKDQKNMTPSDLPFLYALQKKINTNHLNENNFYTCFYIGRILIKFHLDNITPAIYCEQAIAIATKLGDKCLLIKGYHLYSSFFTNVKHDLVSSNKYFGIIDSVQIANNLNGIDDCGVDMNVPYSVLYFYLNDYGKALQYLDRSIELIRKTNKQGKLFDLYVRCAMFQTELKNFVVALKTLDTARSYIHMLPDSVVALNNLRADSFNIYVEVNDQHAAILLERKVDITKLDVGNDEYYTYMYNLIKLEILEAQYKLAEKNITQYVSELKPWNIQRWQNAYEVKYLLDKAKGNTVAALQSYEKYMAYNDSVHFQKQNYAVLAQQIKYDTRQKEAGMKLQIAANQTRQQRSNFIIALTAALCLLLMVLLGYRINLGLRQKDRLNKSFALQLIRNTEREQQRLANELHDGLGQELLLLKNSLLHDDDKVKAERVGEIIENVRDMSRELYPALLEVVGLESAIKNQLQKIDEQESIFISSNIEFPGVLDSHTKLQVYRIFQEAVTNVLKYANATSVLIELKEQNGIVTLTIKDNGQGFDVEEKLAGIKGFGLKSMRKRSESINGELKIISLKNKGTTVTLNFLNNENISS